MLTLVTTNPAKYAPFAQTLERMRIHLAAPKVELPELQCASFLEALKHKAQGMSRLFGHAVLVDDAGLVLEAYQPFPGPLTSVVLRSLGHAGLKRLLQGVSDRATMECHLGWWKDNTLRSWSGVVKGRIDLERHPLNDRMLLTDLFVPDPDAAPGALPHRAQALSALESDAFELHLDASARTQPEEAQCPTASPHQCPFCTELEGTGESIFSEMIRDRLASRIVYEDENFVVMPPIGQLLEGGLLLLTRPHILSMAYLPEELFAPLEKLLNAISRELASRWGVPPLIFEHGPAPQRSKGVCCVDHAHLNIFPAKVRVQPHLASRMNCSIEGLAEISKLRTAEFGYLFVQENDGSRRAYDGRLVPTQLVRRIITAQLGFPERWHWKDYPGYAELLATYQALKGRIRP